MKKQYWIVKVFGCVEPYPPYGPYESWDQMVKSAKRIWRRLNPYNDAIFWMVTDPKLVKPQMGSFSGSVLE